MFDQQLRAETKLTLTREYIIGKVVCRVADLAMKINTSARIKKLAILNEAPRNHSRPLMCCEAMST